MSDESPRILLADDQPDVLEALRLLLKNKGFTIETASSPAAVYRAVGARPFDVVLIDLNYARDTTSGVEGLQLLERLHAYDDLLPIVVMTAWGSVELAVEAMRHGARDFVQKPWENVRLLATLNAAVEVGRALRQSRRLEAENRLLRRDGQLPLLARSPAMQPVLDLVARVGPSDAAVLITGENGAGKGVVANALHSVSRRAARSFVSVNVGGLAETVFESEMFGHVKGAFTDARADRAGRFELASGGTLFLDEIANVQPAQQARLLRVLETGEFEPVGSSMTRKSDVRVISATNARIEEEVDAGRFRQDLFFRLRTVEIRLPPLRERRDDIPLLAGEFLSRYATRYRKTLSGFDENAMRGLLVHSWPGNIRELDHAIERAVLMAAGNKVTAADLGLQPLGDRAPRIDDMTLEEVEALLIRKALARYDGNVSRAAEALGVSRSALYRRMQRHNL
ncbi:MAG: sigma-54-dependent Fis family transcriptional regulator [Acidobacteria bacterium]|nr:sigma-54-dependent Fis family transcriptional regulator [Acidobacteriota bacterium]MBV9478076.1 sigma-54-dependent Fis family transcriptional regulator [Acidobacteriota bacterium]